MTTALDIVYFSSVSGNTARFVRSLSALLPTAGIHRIPLRAGDTAINPTRAFVLITPTYGGGNGQGAVPKQVIRFLNDERNRVLLRGVISCGNTNFGAAFCLAGDIIARKCDVPHLARIEVFGTPEDVVHAAHALRTLAAAAALAAG